MSGAQPRQLSADSRRNRFRVFGEIDSRLRAFEMFLREELANRPGRVRSSVRMALITALGAGLMAEPKSTACSLLISYGQRPPRLPPG
jgi:hypothetical protein